MSAVAVSIDPQRCVCSGYCARLAPDVFRLRSPDPTEVVRAEADGPQVDAVMEAAELCPTKAIIVAAPGARQ